MNQNISFPALALFAAIAFALSGCDKVKDIIIKDPLADLKICNIKMFTIRSGTYTRNATCSYNAYGNPVFVSFSFVATAYPNEEFRYDSHQRLTDHIQPYDGNDIYEQWHRFTYDDKDRIISAANYQDFGHVSTGPQRPPYSTTYFEYDDKGRIVKTTLVYTTAGTPDRINTYAYDANGNLIKPGVVYDNKVNVHRTNKVWMFLDRDYSRNNPVSMQTHNKYGLPVEVGSGFGPYFLQGSLVGSIRYLCDQD